MRPVEKTAVVLQRLKAAMPDARCELIYLTPFHLLVSVVLSAKNTDKMVNRVMEPLYRSGFTPETVMKWGAAGFLERIRSIGLAPTKAKNVHALSAILLEKFGGEVPSKREDLESLPGVGRKTASVVMGELFQLPTLAVDTHVYRVSRRLGLQDESTTDKAERALLKLIAPEYLPLAHHLLLLHGRYVCKAMKPECEACILADLCPSASFLAETKVKKKKAPAKAPSKKKSSSARASL